MTFLVVLKRELRSIALLPQSYGIAFAFVVLSGIFFLTFLIQSSLPDLERWYSNIATTLLVLAPVVAMRSFAEERRSGALDVTLSWPISRTSLAAGKFVANTLYLWALLTVAWLYVRLLTRLGEVEVGKAAAGFIGIVLFAAALSALALAVSARTSSPAAAAFLGFGLLFILWSLQYAPRWLGEGGAGELIAYLSPATHLESALQGVLVAKDIAYFLACVAIGLGLTVQSLDGQRAGTWRRVSVRRRSLLGGVGLAAVLLLAGGSSIAAQADLTPTRRLTVTRQTREVGKRVQGPVKITGFTNPDGASAVEMRALIRRYENAGIPIDFEMVDPDTQPGRARGVGVTGYNQLFVEVAGRHEIVRDIGEVPLTSALLRLSRTEAAAACFTTGHGEPDLVDRGPRGYDNYAASLHQLGYDTKPLALAAPGAKERLAKCKIVITGPQVPFLPSEIALLQDYLANQGRLVVMADPRPAARDQLNDLLRPWGVAWGTGTVKDRSALADDPASVVAFSYPSESPVTLPLKRDGIPALLVAPTPIEKTPAADEQSVIPLVASSSKSSTEQAKGPFTLAALVDASRVTGPRENLALATTRIGVIGSSAVASNRLIDSFGNHQLVEGIVQWAARDSDVISAAREFGGVRKVVLTSVRRNDLVRQGIVFPGLAMLFPLPVALLRLRRG